MLNIAQVETVIDDTDVAMILIYHWKESNGEVIFFQDKSKDGWKLNEICLGSELFREHIV